MDNEPRVDPTLADLISEGVVWWNLAPAETRIRRAAVAARELMRVSCGEYGSDGYRTVRPVAAAYRGIQAALATHSPDEIDQAQRDLVPVRDASTDPDVWIDRAVTDLMQARNQCRSLSPLAAKDAPHVRYLTQMRELRTDGADIVWFLNAADALERWWQLMLPHLFRPGTTASEIVGLVNA